MKTKIRLYDTQIRQDEQGRFCLNDLHQSSGGEVVVRLIGYQTSKRKS